MKKSLAFLLALCLTINMSGMVFAEEIPPDISETAVTETQQEEITSDAKLEDTDTTDISTADTDSTLDSGTPNTSIVATTPQGEGKEDSYELVFSSATYDDLIEKSYQKPRAAIGNYFGNQLEGDALEMYIQMLAYLEEIDTSGTGSGMLEVDGLTIFTDDAGYQALDEAYVNAADALFKDHTALTYWMAKGADANYVWAFYQSGGIGNGKGVLIFPVVEKYQGEKVEFQKNIFYHMINANAGADGKTKEVAFANADTFLKGVTGTDYEKIKQFNEWICERTTYGDPDKKYGDESQIISVFLGGEMAVCEGYAKAFQYLCDESNIGCILVEGLLKGNNHMWNYVELDGKWYIVDVTNNDGGNPIQGRLAIGSSNKAYASYDSTRVYDANGKPIQPLNPTVTVEKNDYTPPVVPEKPEEINIEVRGATASKITIEVSTVGQTGDSYQGKYVLSKSDLVVTQLLADDKPGKEFAPSAVATEKPGSFVATFSPVLPAGKYRVSINDKTGFNIAGLTNATFSVRAAMPDTKTTFSTPDTKGEVTVTITVPNVKDPVINYCINGGSWEYGTGTVTFQISATKPDGYLTKEITSFATHTDYDDGKEVTASYTFKPADDAFQVIVTPVTGLYGEINTKVHVATLSTKNAKGTVSYEVDNKISTLSGAIIDGDKVYTNPQDNQVLKPGDHTLYIKALDSGAESLYAYGSGVIHVAEKAPSKPDDNDSDDSSDSGSSGGGGSSGSSTTTTSSSSVATTPSLSTEIATKEAEKSVTAAIAQAIASNAKTATASVVIRNTDAVSASTLKAIIDAVQKASVGKGVVVKPMLISDVVGGNAILSRLYIDPAKATLNTDIKLGVALENKPVSDLFAKYYSNKMSVVSFAQQGSFGMPVEVAVKLDLSKFDTKALKFYTYDAKTNVYAEMTAPNPGIDANGYLHFTTTIGGNVVITDKPLTRK